LATDPLGTLPQGEGTLFAGTGGQTHSASRWGDYSMLSLDPVDGCTFWYTNEYVQTTGSAPWRTRIGSFQLPGCGGGGGPTATPTATGTATNTPTATSTPTATFTPTATGTPAPTTSTGFLAPTAQAAQTSSAGDNNGYQTNPTNAFVNDSVYAIDTNSGTGSGTSCTGSGKDKHNFYNYNFSIPGTAVVKGLEVRLDARADSTSGSPHICVQISWNGGTTWTTAKQTATLSTGELTYVLGTPTDIWGHTWSVGDFSNTNFRIRVIDVSSNTSRDFSLDYIAVNVTYQP
jgi:hypothetical protein